MLGNNPPVDPESLLDFWRRMFGCLQLLPFADPNDYFQDFSRHEEDYLLQAIRPWSSDASIGSHGSINGNRFASTTDDRTLDCVGETNGYGNRDEYEFWRRGSASFSTPEKQEKLGAGSQISARAQSHTNAPELAFTIDYPRPEGRLPSRLSSHDAALLEGNDDSSLPLWQKDVASRMFDDTFEGDCSTGPMRSEEPQLFNTLTGISPRSAVTVYTDATTKGLKIYQTLAARQHTEFSSSGGSIYYGRENGMEENEFSARKEGIAATSGGHVFNVLSYAGGGVDTWNNNNFPSAKHLPMESAPRLEIRRSLKEGKNSIALAAADSGAPSSSTYSSTRSHRTPTSMGGSVDVIHAETLEWRLHNQQQEAVQRTTAVHSLSIDFPSNTPLKEQLGQFNSVDKPFRILGINPNCSFSKGAAPSAMGAYVSILENSINFSPPGALPENSCIDHEVGVSGINSVLYPHYLHSSHPRVSSPEDITLFYNKLKHLFIDAWEDERLFRAIGYLNRLEAFLQHYTIIGRAVDEPESAAASLRATASSLLEKLNKDDIVNLAKVNAQTALEIMDFFHLDHMKTMCEESKRLDFSDSISFDLQSAGSHIPVTLSSNDGSFQHLRQGMGSGLSMSKNGLFDNQDKRKHRKLEKLVRRSGSKKGSFTKGSFTRAKRFFANAPKKESAEGWVQEKEKSLDLWYRGEKNLSISVKVRGKLRCELIQVLSILFETDLQGNWAPWFKYASRESHVGRTSQLVRQVFEYPLLGTKESIMYGFGLNVLEEAGCVMIITTAPPETLTHPDIVSPKKGKLPRVRCADLCFVLYPRDKGKYTTMEMYANYNHGLKLVPFRVIAVFLKKVIRGTFQAIAMQCKDFEASIYADRMKNNPTFYGWMSKNLSDYFAHEGYEERHDDNSSLASFDLENSGS